MGRKGLKAFCEACGVDVAVAPDGDARVFVAHFVKGEACPNVGKRAPERQYEERRGRVPTLQRFATRVALASAQRRDAAVEEGVLDLLLEAVARGGGEARTYTPLPVLANRLGVERVRVLRTLDFLQRLRLVQRRTADMGNVRVDAFALSEKGRRLLQAEAAKGTPVGDVLARVATDAAA